jgi:predicted aldo/keto reductase-like oxidoreductase
MQYRALGRTGIHVSPYALGAMNFGAMANSNHEAATAIIRRALDAGINLIDTADNQRQRHRDVDEPLHGRRDCFPHLNCLAEWARRDAALGLGCMGL